MKWLPQFCGRAAAAWCLTGAVVVPCAAHDQAVLSKIVTNYTIEVSLDVDERTLTGRQRLQWRNAGDEPTDELWFHLYWNAWRNDRSTWMQEYRIGRGARNGPKREIEDWGWIEVESVTLRGVTAALGGGGQEEAVADLPEPDAPVAEAPAAQNVDLTPTIRFAAPDDGNPDDRTVMVLSLPEAVEPGQTVDLELTFRSKIPRTVARTGVHGDYYFIGHWFPKLGVYESDRWNCHQFHASTEFYADFGGYDVTLTVPEEYVVGATGHETRRETNGDGTATHRYSAWAVHDFAWTAGPDFIVREETVRDPRLAPLDLRLLIQPEHQGQTERHFEAARAAFTLFSAWFGPNPVGEVTIVDPAWGSHTGGMEYPGLFTAGTRNFVSSRGSVPGRVIVHEMGHQFWQGLVANNEFEHSWLDEGLTAYSTNLVLDATYPPWLLTRRYLSLPGGPSRSKGLIPVAFPGIEISRWSRELRLYRRIPLHDVPAAPSYRYYPGSFVGLTYGKNQLWLRTLELHLGWETMREVLSTFYERYRMSHPRPEDFFAVAAEVAGRDLSWFFDQVVGDSVTFDYAVSSVASFPASAEGWVDRDGEPVYQGPPEDPSAVERFRTEVVVRRLGAGHFPVDVVMVFEDGHVQRERWDDRESWRLFAVERDAKLEYAEIDPERVLMLDVSRINNSLYRKPQSDLPAVKWGTKWMIWLQDRLASFAFFL